MSNVRERRRVLIPESRIPYYFNSALVLHPHHDEFSFFYRDPKDLREMFQLWGMQKGGVHFNTKAQRRRIEQILSQSQGVLRTYMIVCPPYTKKELGSRENDGIMTSIEQDPLDYNFAYSYKGLLHVYYEWIRFMNNVVGVRTFNYVVLGDWALRDSDRAGNYQLTEPDTKRSLNSFARSMRKWILSHYSDVDMSLLRFMQVPGIRSNLPWVMPQTPRGKMEQVRSWLDQDDGELKGVRWLVEQYDSHGLDPVRARLLGDTNKLYKSIASLEPPMPLQDEINVFIRIWRDASFSRQSEIASRGNFEDVTLDGFWDALLKHIEYRIYAREILSYHGIGSGDNLLCFLDVKYPSSGWSFNFGGMNPVFIDPSRVYVPNEKLGIKVNVFD